MSPISHTQLLFAYILSGMARGFFLGIGTLIVAMLFMRFTIEHFFIFMAYSLLVSFLFACCGIIIGLWANEWEQLNIFINFVVTPLTFLGGIFYTLDMVPKAVAIVTQLNPIYYLINGTRYGMLGIAEGNVYLGLMFVAVVSALVYWLAYYLVKTGYHLKV